MRLASNLRDFTMPDVLYEEVLDCFTSFGRERRPRADRTLPELPWTAFIPDSELEVPLRYFALF
jgi:hypothetical protein